jgi:hypothetical protein
LVSTCGCVTSFKWRLLGCLTFHIIASQKRWRVRIMTVRTIHRAKPRKTPVQARSTATVEAINQATFQVLVSVAADLLTTTGVAERAGVSVGTLYQYFPDKHALLLPWPTIRESESSHMGQPSHRKLLQKSARHPRCTMQPRRGSQYSPQWSPPAE